MDHWHHKGTFYDFAKNTIQFAQYLTPGIITHVSKKEVMVSQKQFYFSCLFLLLLGSVVQFNTTVLRQ